MEPQTQDWQAVLGRLERVERQNRRTKQLVLVLVILVFSFVLMGQAPKKRTVEANEFILRAPDGAIRAALHMDGDQPALALYDVNGKLRAGLSMAPQVGPQLVLVSANPKAGSGSQVTADGFSIYHQENLRAFLWVTADGNPGLTLTDANGQHRADLSMLGGEPGLVLRDEGGKGKVSLSADPQLGGHFILDSANSSTGVQVTGNGLRLYHQEKPRAVLSLGDDGAPAFLLLGANGNPIWFAPASPSLPQVAGSDARPRVFVEAWADFSEALHRVGGQRKEQPFDEIAAMTQSCPQAVVTVERQKADYILVFRQEYSSEASRAYYQYTAFHSGGAVLGTGANAPLSGAAGEACTAIMRDWSSKAR